MAIPLLRTKLYVPPVHPNLVPRPRLIERLDAGVRSAKLTLVSAPAGSGKTTLLSAWIAGDPRAVAWLSLDRGDNDIRRFLEHLVAALQTIEPDIGVDVLRALQSPEFPPLELPLTLLVNDLAQIPPEERPSGPRHVVVLDDYHVIDTPAIHQALAFLLDHLPPQLHLILLTREDPPLPLARLRVQRQVCQIRARDLRFTLDEVTQFFDDAPGLHLKAEDVAALESRTEGWIAGLQMAALALQGLAQQGTTSVSGHRDAASFIASFAGSHRFVLDYLLEEVLHQQPESVQTFLLRTSILDRLCGPLCDAVWSDPETPPLDLPGLADSSTGSQSILEYLERANLFVVPLDDERRYYRYHHLFSGMLRHRLERSFPALVPRLHARAATWFEEQEDAPEAFEHWIAAGDTRRAAHVVETQGYSYFEKADFHQLSYWLENLPPELIETRPWLCVFHSWWLIFTGQYEEADRHLMLAEKALGPVTEASDVDLREQYGHVAASRAFLASRSLDGEGIMHYVDLALKYISSERRAMHGYVAFFRGTGSYEGQYALAQESWREAARLNTQAGNLLVAVNCLVALGELNRVQGKLAESLSVNQEAAQLGLDERGDPLPVSVEVYVARARLHYEWNDFETAEADLFRAAELMGIYQNFDLKVDHHTWLSYLRLAQGQPVQAGDLIFEIEASDREPFFRSAAAFLACRITYYLAVGDLAIVEQIVAQQDWNLADKNLFVWADVFLAYAHVLVHQGALDRANDLLDACRTKLEHHELWTPALKALIMQALIAQLQGEGDVARHQIQRALMLAEPEGFIRIFVDEGPLVAQLLSEAATRGMLPDYTRKLLAAFDAEDRGHQGISYPLPTDSVQPLVDPLSPRELEVLQLIAEGLSNREIAEKLFVALPTVKGHNSEIYAKLQVHRRTEAVARARELGLL